MTVVAAKIEEEPLFRCAHDALVFAYRYNGQQYAPTPVAKMMRGRIGSGKGLVGVDGAAQAGIIRGLLKPLDPWEQAAIIAKYAIYPKELLWARNSLIVPVMAALPTGMHNRRMVDVLVQRYYGRRVRLKELAATHGLSASAMTVRWQAVRNALQKIEYRAIDRAEARLIDAGLCL